MKIQLTQNAASVAARLQGFPTVMRAAIRKAMDRENLLTAGWIVKSKLTAAGPKFLNVRSGRLRGSVRATKAVVTDSGVESSIGSNVKYAGVHEYGFRGTVSVRAFQRRSPQGDRFRQGGKVVSRRNATGGKRALAKAQVSSGRAFVRSHTRKVFFPERAMFRTGINERAPQYNQAISAAILRAWVADLKGGAQP